MVYRVYICCDVSKKMSEVIPNMDETVLDLLMGMLKYDPSKRITAKQALTHVRDILYNLYSHIL